MGIPHTDNPKVIAHIKGHPYDEKRRMYHCGCITAKDDTIMLCQWHDGYDEGLAEAAFDQRADREAIIRQTWKLARPPVPRREPAVIDRIIAAAEQETPGLRQCITLRSRDVFTPSPLMVRFFRDWKPPT